jgi:hypothetical protein
MALEKISVVDKVEVVENGTVQVRTATRIVEDGNVISQSYHRHTISTRSGLFQRVRQSKGHLPSNTYG